MKISNILLVLVLSWACSHSSGARKPASSAFNILMIGDSHTAGPFGQYVHQSLATRAGLNIVTYGHSSSAALHWLSSRRSKLTGGVYHQLSAHKTFNAYELVRMDNPNPTDWREAVEVPFFEPLVEDMNLHPEWRNLGFPVEAPNLVVIALGANDRGYLFNRQGQFSQVAFDRHVNYARTLAQKATEAGAKCLWIGPPHGRVKTDEEQEALYRMLHVALEEVDCQLVSSNHYKAMGCDGVHFNCRAELPAARNWANEMVEHIRALID